MASRRGQDEFCEEWAAWMADLRADGTLRVGRWLSTVSRLALEHVEHHANEVRLRLGREPVVLSEPLARLALQLVACRRGHAAIGEEDWGTV